MADSIDDLLVEIASNLGGKAYEVGGCVRDSILGIEPKDRDFIVTKVPQDKLIEALSRSGETDLVGRSFGVIKFKYGGKTYDVTTPRKDRYFGYGHTDVAVTVDPDIPLKEDLRRRDFTMNAMARDLVTKELYDPFDAHIDLTFKVITPVDGIHRCYTEDPLRLMRAVQFAARFGFNILFPDDVKKHAHLIRHVAPERIAIELVKMFKAPKPSIGLNHMRDLGLLEILLPEVHACIGVPQPAKWHVYDVYNHLLYAMDRIPWKKQVYLRVAALLHDIGKPGTFTDTDGDIHFYGHQKLGAEMAVGLLDRLRLHTVEGFYFPADRVIQLIREHMFECNLDSPDRIVRRFVGKLTKKGTMDQIRLRIADRLAGRADDGEVQNVGRWVEFAKRVRTLSAPKKSVYNLKALAINGRDLVDTLGEKPGPIIGKLLKLLLDAVIDNPELNDKQTLLALATESLESEAFIAEQIGEKPGQL
jgi:tRNA nucleotidyltransferase (CCA-adding enzyme)